ncbi:MAG TPA: hypothetical protein VFU22_20350 [Roseiflexaceae bacterium]|nr:hypothetical protein [Roseiflexaceae bacterium]
MLGAPARPQLGQFEAWITANRGERLGREYTPRIAAIFEEDRAIVESQRPELLPLDLQTELHLRSDRVADRLPALAALWDGVESLAGDRGWELEGPHPGAAAPG